MRGFVEAVAPDQVRGWAYDPDFPDEHVAISVLLDGIPAVTGIANRQRHDLLSAGIGQGDHGFAIDLTPKVAPERLDDIAVFARIADGLTRLDRALPSPEETLNAASNPMLPVSDDQQHPVFILGPARSGTSALALALLKSGRYEGFGEGHLLPLALKLLQVTHEFYDGRRSPGADDTLIRKVGVRTFERMVRRSFVQLTRSVFPTGHWLDKTPTVEMVRAAPLMREIWPNARFVFIKRRMIENVISRLRKFPHESMEYHYMDWVGVMQSWLDVRHMLADVSIEVEHLDLARDPAAVSTRLAAFLNLPEEAARKLARSLCDDHPEQTADRVGAVCEMAHLGLTEDEQVDLTEACDAMMFAYGYDYSERYFAT